MFDELAKLFDQVSTDAAMMAVNARKTAKGTMAPDNYGRDWVERWDRIAHNLNRANAMVAGLRQQ